MNKLKNIAICDISINQFNSKSEKQEFKKIKSTWYSMMYRCYSDKSHLRYPSYKDCSVVNKWHLFSNFFKWAKNQDYIGNHLDKDLKVPGNKIYSPDNCMYISHKINCLFKSTCRRSKSDTPIGVFFYKPLKKYSAYISRNSKVSLIGVFDNPEDAGNAYKLARYKYIKDIAANESGEVKKYLLMRANDLFFI